VDALRSLWGRSPDPVEGLLGNRFLFSVLSGAASPAFTLDLGAESPDFGEDAPFSGRSDAGFEEEDLDAEDAFVPVFEVDFSFKELKFGPQRYSLFATQAP